MEFQQSKQNSINCISKQQLTASNIGINQHRLMLKLRYRSLFRKKNLRPELGYEDKIGATGELHTTADYPETGTLTLSSTINEG
jgi:hypothetical protein